MTKVKELQVHDRVEERRNERRGERRDHTNFDHKEKVIDFMLFAGAAFKTNNEVCREVVRALITFA